MIIQYNHSYGINIVHMLFNIKNTLMNDDNFMSTHICLRTMCVIIRNVCYHSS